jgi:Mg/Co/Ni transporter MgtE
MFNPLLLPELREMLSTGDDTGLSDVMTELHPATIADFSEGLSVEETWRLLDHAQVDRQAEVFAFFPLPKQEEMVSGIGQERMSKLLEAMSPDDRVDLLKRLDQKVVENLLPLVAKAERQDIRTLLSFPEGSAGSVNSGSQAATLITRALALGQIAPSDWWRALRHELLVGLALGATLGAIGFVRASLTPTAVLGDADRWMLAMVIGQAVAIICIWGTLVGSMLPLLFKRLGFDPGYASSPFVATFVDVTGIVIYFSIAKTYLL